MDLAHLGISFYITYEELKPNPSMSSEVSIASFYITYEELKLSVKINKEIAAYLFLHYL